MKRRSKAPRVVILMAYLGVGASAVASVLFGVLGQWTLLEEFAPEAGSGGLLWQVHTTFLSVGFAGLAIATQLFSESPVAIGATRADILRQIRVADFVRIGLASNAVIALEVIWFDTDAGLLTVTLGCLVPTVGAMIWSAIRMLGLMGNPTQLDKAVQTSLVASVRERIQALLQTYSLAVAEMESIAAQGLVDGPSHAAMKRIAVRASGENRVVARVHARAIRAAIQACQPVTTDDAAIGMSSTDDSSTDDIWSIEIAARVRPGARVPNGGVTFWLYVQGNPPDMRIDQVKSILQGSLTYEPSEHVTLDEEITMEIGLLRDAVSSSLRSGAFSLAERALTIIEAVLSVAWTKLPETPPLSSGPMGSLRGDWLYRVIAEIELDATLSRQATTLFTDHALQRVLESPRVGSYEHFTASLASFVRLGELILDEKPTHTQAAWHRLLVCIQNLAEYSFSSEVNSTELRVDCVWIMVEMVKRAMDANNPVAAAEAADYLSELFTYSQDDLRDAVVAGQLVLTAWISLLAARGNTEWTTMESLQTSLAASADRTALLRALEALGEDGRPRRRWEWWEVPEHGPAKAHVLELSSYVDRAVVDAMARSWGVLPPATDDNSATYRRLLAITEEKLQSGSNHLETVKEALKQSLVAWEKLETKDLADTELSDDRIKVMVDRIREELSSRERLSDLLPKSLTLPEEADSSKPVLGMNLRVPREYFVDKVFKHTYADPAQLGDVIARGFIDGEDRRIVTVLKELSTEADALNAKLVGDALTEAEAGQSVLLAPFGGPDFEEWWSSEFRAHLDKVTLVETAALQNELILFDRSSLLAIQKPEEKTGLTALDEARVSVGVFEDVFDEAKPLVRVEVGEYFVVWPSDVVSVTHFRGETPSFELS